MFLGYSVEPARPLAFFKGLARVFAPPLIAEFKFTAGPASPDHMRNRFGEIAEIAFIFQGHAAFRFGEEEKLGIVHRQSRAAHEAFGKFNVSFCELPI